jgi:hypothetical protein
MPPEISPAGADTTAALRRALDAVNAENTRLRGEVGTTQARARESETNARAAQLSMIDSSITAAETEASTLSDRWAALQAEGNFTDASKVMLKMNEAAARGDRLKAQKEWLANQPQPQTPAAAGNDVNLSQYNEAERNWISRNPAYLSDAAVRARVTEAHNVAIYRDNLVKDTPEYYAALERAAYPDRHPAAETPRTPAATGGAADAGSAAGDVDGSGEDNPLSGGADLDDRQPSASVSLDRHTRNADPQNRASLDAPAMRIEVTPGAAAASADPALPPPRVRAAGLEGGASLRGVAAPPSRRVIQASNRAAQQHGGVIEPTREEIDTALALAESLEPDLLRRGTEEVVRWYYTLYHSPTHRSAKRRNWVYGNAA